MTMTLSDWPSRIKTIAISIFSRGSKIDRRIGEINPASYLKLKQASN